ncbi:ROK family protein [Necropsobacter rosorum]|uniref:ROK family protein n=1 Tax=Necropsobacter rosorum TaxID=908285 RepID=UPI0005098B0D
MSVIWDVKQSNYQNIYKLFFSYNQLSKPQIARLLNLSLPTVVNNIMELEKEGKIIEQGLLQSEGGRPATAYKLVSDAFVSIGVEIQQKMVKCVVIDLQGHILNQNKAEISFENNLKYIETLYHHIHSFIEYIGYDSERILGIGISVQGIADKNRQTILYGKILSGGYSYLKYLQPYFNMPVMLFHDVKCAATAELWQAKLIDNAIYVSISEHLGGALIINNQIDLGKKGYSGALEHLQIHRRGNSCYCGQKGCLETYCSLSALLKNHNETIEHFFQLLRENDQEVEQRWENFLNNLALGLNTAYLLLERDIILGGDIAPYLVMEDIVRLQSKIEKIATFPIDEDFIRIAQQQNNASAIGAGLPLVIEYLEKQGVLFF